MFTLKLKFILLPQLIATLNNYAGSLPPLANVDWSAFPECFCRPCKSTTGEMAPKEGSLQVGCGDLIWLPLSVHVCLGLVVEYWPFVGAYTRHSYSKLYYLCLLSFLIKLLPPPTPPPNIHWPDINEFHQKNCKKLAKTSHCLLVGLVVQ